MRIQVGKCISAVMGSLATSRQTESDRQHDSREILIRIDWRGLCHDSHGPAGFRLSRLLGAGQRKADAFPMVSHRPGRMTKILPHLRSHQAHHATAFDPQPTSELAGVKQPEGSFRQGLGLCFV